jgi:tRNA1Val (adenine37-N6)-methyltransferase
MKVGVDSVMLGAWADVVQAKNILDVGTGCGLLALMLAQRNDNATITAIDIDENAALQAAENVQNSIWKNRIEVQNITLQQFANTTDKRFDLIICNPPFFVNSLQTPDKQRTTARHATDLTHEDLIFCAKKLLTEQGKLSLILPVKEAGNCLAIAELSALFCNRKTTVFPKPNAAPKRILLELGGIEAAIPHNDAITILATNGKEFTPEYTELVKDFYLKM